MTKSIALKEYKCQDLLTLRETVTTKDFFNKYPEDSAVAIYSRIRSLIKKGIIHRIGRGKYAIGASKEFLPTIDNKETQLYFQIKEEFPYSSLAIWNLSTLNSLLQHLVNINIAIIDIDRESVESLYWYLKGKGYNVVTRKRMFDGISEYNGYIFVRPIITSSPLCKNGTVVTASLEKILVDLACDKEFEPFQGSELYHIFENAYNEFTINSDRLLHYAGRKEKREYVNKILKHINRQ